VEWTYESLSLREDIVHDVFEPVIGLELEIQLVQLERRACVLETKDQRVED
jgi:hypothetical protein